ncbi:MAG: endonuclease/exonuclease/phosphatase family protein [Verrucomicrobiae bacterium]|nr:endonuclease/exonuclease/phosphatase family protein [Verrucomicrobiae bacterium]MDW8344056.1 endonuclease/exonuclease/phosphatase family protein [Verrucomicrobiae bacterium]
MTSSWTKFRLLTYNVHRCQGTDRRVSPYRIAEVIAETGADIVALQELDVNRPRTGHVDQAELIAALLEMEFHFHPAWQMAEERFGDAVLSRWPLRLVHAAKLPGHPRGWKERRGAIWVAVQIGGHTVQVINTHLGLVRHERHTQTTALLGSHWLGHPACRPPVILCGDFNAIPGSRVHERYRAVLRDVCDCVRTLRRQRTYPTRLPVARIDHVFVSPDIHVRHVEVVRTRLSRVASDHYPVLVELALHSTAS